MNGAASAIHEAWVSTVIRAGGDPGVAAETAAEMVAAYEQPHRHYHDLSHVRDVLARVGELGGPAVPDNESVVLAACAHDVVYAGRPGDDERDSAMWAGEALLRAGAPPELIARVQALVLTTIDHVVPTDDEAAAVLCDADLAILAAAQPEYDDYVAAVRAEYSQVSDDDWRRGRGDVLRRLLTRDPLYATATGRQRWDAPARANLTRELDALSASG